MKISKSAFLAAGLRRSRIGLAGLPPICTGPACWPAPSAPSIGLLNGREVLEQNPERVDLKVLSQFEEFSDFREAKSELGKKPDSVDTPDQTPEERIETSYRELRSALAANLLDRIHEQTPEFFEQLVLDVLHAMGYGGSRDNAAERLGKSGDEGIDGVIREDRLGLDTIYIQAKRWANTVGRPDVQKFVGGASGPECD
jgi:restriction system protein